MRWDSNPAGLSRYRYGIEDHYDLILVDEPRVLTDNELIDVGVIVKRGRFLREFTHLT